jgi:hypothetical protein
MPDTDQTDSFDDARAGLPDVSPDVSVFWKPLRLLLQEGKPVGPVTVLFHDAGDGRLLPVVSIAKTTGDRLILWPPSDALQVGEFADGRTFPIHHVTLELASGATHFTQFEADGKRLHEGRGWKLATLEDGLKLWLVGAFHVASLEKQVGALEQNVKMPTSDAKRREEEFRRYAAQISQVTINTPRLRGDCLVMVVLLVPASAKFRGRVLPTHFPMGSFWNAWIDGWPDGDKFQIVPTSVNVGGENLLVLTASPLGRVKGACFLGGHRIQHGERYRATGPLR